MASNTISREPTFGRGNGFLTLVLRNPGKKAGGGVPSGTGTFSSVVARNAIGFIVDTRSASGLAALLIGDSSTTPMAGAASGSTTAVGMSSEGWLCHHCASITVPPDACGKAFVGTDDGSGDSGFSSSSTSTTGALSGSDASPNVTGASNTSPQRPQRTHPSEMRSWSGTTLKVVAQTGQRVVRLMGDRF